MEEVEPPGFFFFSDAESEFSSETNHSLLVGGSVGVVSEYWARKAFFGPVVSGHEVVVDEVSGCSRVEDRLGVGDFS